MKLAPLTAALVLAAGPLFAQDVWILGEVHDNPHHHAGQAARVAEIAPTALVFEMLTPAQAAAASGVDWSDMAALEAALDWDSGGWPDFGIYHPIFAAAPESTALYGAAVDRDALMQAMAEGAEAVAPADFLPPVPEDQRATRIALQAEAHCDALPEDLLPGMVEAQRLRDARFAEVVALAHDETGGPVVLITGNGHARTDWGVPAALRQGRPDLEVVALGQFEAAPGPDAPPFDIVAVTPPVDRPDPCLAFR